MNSSSSNALQETAAAAPPTVPPSDLIKRAGIRSLLPIDLNAELKSRLKKSTHASVSNLKKSASNIETIGSILKRNDTTEQNLLPLPHQLPISPDLISSSSSSDTEDGKDLGKLLRSVSKENMYSTNSSSGGGSANNNNNSNNSPCNNMNKVLTNISKRLSNVATAPASSLRDDENKTTSTSDGESSGGREVKTIIKNSAVARRKKLNDG